MNLIELFNYNFYFGSLFEINTQKRSIINTVNPKIYFEAKNDKVLSIALMSSTLLTDSNLFVFAIRILKGKKITKISNIEIYNHLLKQANKNKQRIFYLESSQNSLKVIIQKTKTYFPEIQVYGFALNNSNNFFKKNTQIIIKAINAFKTDILFINSTFPKQEKWVFRNKYDINAQLIVSLHDMSIIYGYQSLLKNYIKKSLGYILFMLKNPKRFYNNFIQKLQILTEVLVEKIS